MDKRTSILIVILLIVAAFLGGSTFAKIKHLDGADKAAIPTAVPQASQPTLPPFEAKKTDQPEVKFFVMSFCPFGNQAEAGLEPVYQLLKNKVAWEPRYIINDEKKSCEQSCPYRVFNDEAKKRCEDAIAQSQVSNMEACREYFPYQNADECLQKECASLKAGEYASLHGDQELNQNVREICAFAQMKAASSVNALDKWWQFVTLVNEKCDSNDADSCWTAQAKAAGLNVSQIAQCQSSQAKSFLANELLESEKYQVSGSPTVFINDVLYNGGRAPEDYKKAICASFNSPPQECSTVLGQESNAASGGCE
jgi:glutaredoxin